MLRSQIEADLQVQVPMDGFLGNNTIAQLAEQLLNLLALANLVASEKPSATANEEREREKLSI